MQRRRPHRMSGDKRLEEGSHISSRAGAAQLSPAPAQTNQNGGVNARRGGGVGEVNARVTMKGRSWGVGGGRRASHPLHELPSQKTTRRSPTFGGIGNPSPPPRLAGTPPGRAGAAPVLGGGFFGAVCKYTHKKTISTHTHSPSTPFKSGNPSQFYYYYYIKLWASLPTPSTPFLPSSLSLSRSLSPPPPRTLHTPPSRLSDCAPIPSSHKAWHLACRTHTNTPPHKHTYSDKLAQHFRS